MTRPFLSLSALALAAAALAAPASASELVVDQQGPRLEVEQGEVGSLTVLASAVDDITCGAQENNPGLAQIDTAYSLVGGVPVPAGAPSDSLAFFRAQTATPPPAGGCPVTWDVAPDPYEVELLIAVAPDTPPGDYAIPVRTSLSGKQGALTDDAGSSVAVRVLPGATPPPPPPPARPGIVAQLTPPLVLPPPRENRTVNLVPVQGKVVITYPRAKKRVRIEDPVQVPVGTKVDSTQGRVQIVSDSDGFGSTQAATFWNDSFSVDYTRAAVPTQRKRRGRRAALPYTELKLLAKCAKKSVLKGAVFSRRIEARDARRRKRRRGLFGSGRGRFRTRGSFGAGTVRGTSWYTEDRCDGTLFLVTSGIVSVRDFGLGRSFGVRRGQGYLAAPHHPREGESQG